MAKKEGYVVDLNKLYRYDDNTGKFVIPKALWANGKEHYAAFSNGSICYNKAYYELYLEDTVLVALASGEIMDPYVYVSKKTDFDGAVFEVPVTDNLQEIQPNYSLTEEKHGTFEVTQEKSNFVLTGTYRQRKDSYTDEYYNLQITDIACPLIPASGASRPLVVYYVVTRIRRYESGKEETKDVSESTSSFVDVDVDTNSGASFDYSTNELTGPDLWHDVTPKSTIAIVEYVKIEAHGLTKDWSGSLSWMQEANERTWGGERYFVNTSVDPPVTEEVGAEGGYVVISLNYAYLRTYFDWTSGAPRTHEDDDIVLNVRATGAGVDYSGTMKDTSGMNEVELYVPANSTGGDRNLSIRVYNSAAGYDETYTYVQSGRYFVRWVFGRVTNVLVDYPEAPAWRNTVYPSVTVSALAYAEYSDGIDSSKTKPLTYSDISVTSASNEEDFSQTTGATLNRNTGAVTVISLGATEHLTPHKVFEVNAMEGVFDDGFGETRKWTWSGSIDIMQSENIEEKDGELQVDRWAVLVTDTLEGSNTIIEVGYMARTVQNWVWSSGSPGNPDITNEPVTITVKGSGVDMKQTPSDGEGYASFNVGVNATTSDRVFTVKAVDKNGSTLLSATVTQQAPATFHYELARVDDANVSYEEAFAWANSVSPYIQVRAWFKKVWSNGTTDPNLVYEDHSVGESGFTISNAAGQARNTSGSTINSSTGVVSVKSLGETATSQRPVFEVQTLYGTFKSSLVNKSLNWQMNDSVIVEQAENQYHNDGDPFYEYTSSIKPSDTAANGELSPVDTEITVYGTARIGQKYYWDSYGDARKTAYTNSVLKVMLNRNFEDVRDLKGANASTTFNVGINSSTTTQRTFLVEVYDTEGRYNQSYYLTQQQNSAQEYWEAPTLNGTIQVEDIPASGEAVLISVPIKQVKKRRVEGSSTSEVVTTYTGSVIAVAIEGQALSGAGVSFNNGYISANNLGTSDISRRTVYTLKMVTVTGQDSKIYLLTLPSWVEIKQAANTWEEVIISSAVDMTPLSGSFDVLGGSKTLMVYATNYSRKEYASGANSGTTANAATVSLSATNGSISPTSMTTTVNGKAATLSVTENVAAAKTISVKATVNPGGSGEKSITASFSQPAVSYAFSAGSDKDCNGTASTVYVTFTSSRNGKAWEPSFSTNNTDATIDKANITISGNVYTVPVVIKANPTTSNRNIVVTATQTRYNGTVTQSVTITQAGAALAVIRTVNAYGSWNSGGTAVVNITAYLSNDSSSSVTFSGIKVELRRRLKTQGYNPESAELVATASYSGSVSVGAGGSSNVSISNITHTRSSSYYYWLAAYATQTTETTYNEIEEYEPEG